MWPLQASGSVASYEARPESVPNGLRVGVSQKWQRSSARLPAGIKPTAGGRLRRQASSRTHPLRDDRSASLQVALREGGLTAREGGWPKAHQTCVSYARQTDAVIATTKKRTLRGYRSSPVSTPIPAL